MLLKLRLRVGGRDAVWRLTRDVLLFGLGAAGFIHEVWTPTAEETERPAILTACLLMMGLSVANRAIDTIRNGRKRNGNDVEGHWWKT